MDGVRDTSDVVACVVERDGAFLMCQRPVHKRHGGLWEFPGGKLESGESLLDGANRELLEELGVSVLAISEAGLSLRDDGSEFVIHFVRTIIRGTPRSLEHLAITWAPPEELARLPLAPSDRRAVHELLQGGL